MRGGSVGEAFVSGAQQLKRTAERALAAGLCGSAGGKLPCGPDTIDEALWFSTTESLEGTKATGKKFALGESLLVRGQGGRAI
ncbi:MAG: hypothetical protein QXI12_10895 [Candidatus Methanomethyliaceae archaeon]